MKKLDRASESLKVHYERPDNDAQLLIINSPSDVGVRLNGGRNGARFAPKAIKAQFAKMASHLSEDFGIKEYTTAEQEAENANFPSAQQDQAKLISDILKKNSSYNIVHLGGGHDHAYPMLKGLQESGIEEIYILNVDAHCDTRIDEQPHSGTPFRNFDADCKIKASLLQYGLHHYANSRSTLTALDKIEQRHFFFKDIQQLTDNFSKLPMPYLHDAILARKKCALFFSLDCDALEASIMEAVSAPNHQGLPLNHVEELMQAFFSMTPHAVKVLGIYEYNPIMDNLSCKGARSMAGLIYNFLLGIQRPS